MTSAASSESPRETARASFARNWWAIGLRGIATGLFGLCVFLLPPPTLAALVMLFAAYLAADGAFAILAGTIAAQHGERWRLQVLEGVVNLTVAGGVLAWHAITLVPFANLVSLWAIITGALMLAASRRFSGLRARRLLALGGTVSTVWGAIVAATGPSATADPWILELWFFAYAILFGTTISVLAVHLLGVRRSI
jgi:uncharacterized membrane protein HdeD (DUF308 family)